MLCFNNNRVLGEEMTPVKCILASRCLRLLSILRCLFCCLYCCGSQYLCGFCVKSLLCDAPIGVLSSSSIILIRKRQLVA